MDKTYDDLLVAVGRALVAWTQTEMQLANLFYTLSGMPTLDKAYAVFDTILSFDTRLDIIDTLMEAENLPALDHEVWLTLSRKLRKQYKKRHELAHFSVASRTEPDGVRTAVSPFLTYGKILRNEARHLSIGEIRERQARFVGLTSALMWHWWAAQKRRGQRKDIPMPSPPIIDHLRASAAQTLADKARKQQSSPGLSQPGDGDG